MKQSEGQNIISFLHEAERLKTLMRHSWLSSGRRESVAEHTWRMSLMAMLLQPYSDKKVDLLKVLKMAIIHDLGEVHATDFPAFKKQPKNKADLERTGLKKLTKKLPPDLQSEILELWEEYEAGETTDAIFAKSLDKTEVLLQHNEADIRFLTKKEIPFNLYYGKEFTDKDPSMKLFRRLMDEETIKLYKDKRVDTKLYNKYI